jgi:hypothetical protein
VAAGCLGLFKAAKPCCALLFLETLAELLDTVFLLLQFHPFWHETLPLKAPYPLIALPTLRPSLSKSHYESMSCW